MQSGDPTMSILVSYFCVSCNVMHFRRLRDGNIIYDCPICGRPTLVLSVEVMEQFTNKLKFLFEQFILF